MMSRLFLVCKEVLTVAAAEGLRGEVLQTTKCVVGMFGVGGVLVAQVVVRLSMAVAQSSCRAFGTDGFLSLS